MNANRKAHLLVWALLVLCCGLALSGCREQDPSLRRVQEAGVLRVGIDPSWPPFEFIDPESGEIAGLDVDLAHAIAGRLGVEVMLVPSGWEGLYGALQVGQFDAIISALPYDRWQAESVAYSSAYFDAGPVLVVSEANTAIARVQDLSGKRVHVELGTEGDVQARRLQKKYPDLTIVSHDTAQAALDALAQDQTAAAIVDAVSARLLMRQTPGLTIVGKPLFNQAYVIAVPLQAESLLAAINRALAEMQDSGELAALLHRWL